LALNQSANSAAVVSAFNKIALPVPKGASFTHNIGALTDGYSVHNLGLTGFAACSGQSFVMRTAQLGYQLGA
jgi:hypothetical protein